MNQNEFIFKIDKKHTPFLLKAIDAVIKNGYDISNYYIAIKNIVHKNNDHLYYTVNFYKEEVTQDNWMDMSPGIAGGINVDIDIKTQEVIYIYGDS